MLDDTYPPEVLAMEQRVRAFLARIHVQAWNTTADQRMELMSVRYSPLLSLLGKDQTIFLTVEECPANSRLSFWAHSSYLGFWAYSMEYDKNEMLSCFARIGFPCSKIELAKTLLPLAIDKLDQFFE